MIEEVSAEEIKEFADLKASGLPMKTVSHRSGIPPMRLKRYLRLYDKFGAEFFPRSREAMGKSKENNERLRALVDQHSLTRLEIAELINAPMETVKNWLRGPESKGFRTMPSYALELLTLKVEKELSNMRRAKD